MDENLRYETGKAEYETQVVQFLLDYFRVNEPCSVAINLQIEDIIEVYSLTCRLSLRDPTSFVVFDSSNAVVACRLSSLVYPEDKEAWASITVSKKGMAILNLLDQLEQLLPSFLETSKKVIKKPFKFQIVCVRPDYFRKGIAEKLIQMSIAKAKEIECDSILVTASAFKSQKLFNKFGFETAGIIKHADYLDENGKQIIITNDNTCYAAMMVKIL